jgi:hypothetical protein
MKIGIITFYWSKNLGALIQSISIKKFLEELDNKNRVKFNNYQPKQLLLREFNSQLKTFNPIKYYKAVKKNIRLIDWKNSQNFPKPSFVRAYFDDDMYVYGSDEIWNFQSSVFNIESHFFGLNNKKEKIAYAVSIGNAKDFKKIDDNVIKSLKSFKSISVRDNNTFEFVKNLIGVNPKIVCDPSLLLEIPAQHIKLNLYQNIEYALVYGRYFSNKEIRNIKKYASNKNLKIVSVSYYNLWSDINVLHANPNEFIYLIQNARIVFTSMFHGVILSFKYKNNFWFSQDPYRINKLSFFVKKFNLFSRTMEHLNDAKINFKIYNYSLEDWIESSKEYLRKNIK